MDGAVVPEGWRGALPITYHLGPGPARVRLKLAFKWDRVTAYNVIARLEGEKADLEGIEIAGRTDNGIALDDNYGWPVNLTFLQAGLALKTSVLGMRLEHAFELDAVLLKRVHQPRALLVDELAHVLHTQTAAGGGRPLAGGATRGGPLR